MWQLLYMLTQPLIRLRRLWFLVVKCLLLTSYLSHAASAVSKSKAGTMPSIVVPGTNSALVPRNAPAVPPPSDYSDSISSVLPAFVTEFALVLLEPSSKAPVKDDFLASLNALIGSDCMDAESEEEEPDEPEPAPAAALTALVFLSFCIVELILTCCGLSRKPPAQDMEEPAEEHLHVMHLELQEDQLRAIYVLMPSIGGYRAIIEPGVSPDSFEHPPCITLDEIIRFFPQDSIQSFIAYLKFLGYAPYCNLSTMPRSAFTSDGKKAMYCGHTAVVLIAGVVTESFLRNVARQGGYDAESVEPRPIPIEGGQGPEFTTRGNLSGTGSNQNAYPSPVQQKVSSTSSGSTPGKSRSAWPSSPSKTPTLSSMPKEYYHCLGFEDDVPIFDGRASQGRHFLFRPMDFDNLASMPRYKPGHDLGYFSLVAVGYTPTVWTVGREARLSTNVQFVVVLGWAPNADALTAAGVLQIVHVVFFVLLCDLSVAVTISSWLYGWIRVPVMLHTFRLPCIEQSCAVNECQHPQYRFHSYASTSVRNCDAVAVVLDLVPMLFGSPHGSITELSVFVSFRLDTVVNGPLDYNTMGHAIDNYDDSLADSKRWTRIETGTHLYYCYMARLVELANSPNSLLRASFGYRRGIVDSYTDCPEHVPPALSLLNMSVPPVLSLCAHDLPHEIWDFVLSLLPHDVQKSSWTELHLIHVSLDGYSIEGMLSPRGHLQRLYIDSINEGALIQNPFLNPHLEGGFALVHQLFQSELGCGEFDLFVEDNETFPLQTRVPSTMAMFLISAEHHSGGHMSQIDLNGLDVLSSLSVHSPYYGIYTSMRTISTWASACKEMPTSSLKLELEIQGWTRVQLGKIVDTPYMISHLEGSDKNSGFSFKGTFVLSLRNPDWIVHETDYDDRFAVGQRYIV
ncbi:uncharacterized protein EV420DRAFT_1483038 [Desarmillaria tabescens]|uniref:Uncharacterized protein n=1 Tax=Armillaria tabescens TaxID=1929756 RepID=A0AA39JVQ7_ARMTA|nr:uncharacterized protein EV420DRAFT_1483038 [Desarmillaria tabescens]KAK0449815.1 hypothetical protein EV420DRAFT_1483038 [Desarmillaria tabescens]